MRVRAFGEEDAELKVKQAIKLLGEAREYLTAWAIEECIRENITELGGHGFINSIGSAMVKAATIKHTKG